MALRGMVALGAVEVAVASGFSGSEVEGGDSVDSSEGHFWEGTDFLRVNSTFVDMIFVVEVEGSISAKKGSTEKWKVEPVGRGKEMLRESGWRSMVEVSFGTFLAKRVTTMLSAVWYHSWRILLAGVWTPSGLGSETVSAEGFLASLGSMAFFSAFFVSTAFGSSTSGNSSITTLALSSPSSNPFNLFSIFFSQIPKLASFSFSFLTHPKHSRASAHRSSPNKAIPLLNCAWAIDSRLPRFLASTTAVSASSRAEV